MKRHLLHILIFSIGFSLAQLTRNVDYERAIGFAIRAFWETMGAGLTLFALGLGGLALFNILTDKADSIADLLITRR